MLEFSPLNPHPFVTAFIAVVALALLAGLGSLLVPCWVTGTSKLLRLAVALASGLLFVTGVTATLALGRVCYLTLLPAVQVIAAGAWYLRKGGEASPPEPWSRTEVLQMTITVLACLAFTAWHHQWRMADGGVRLFHSDLGYFIQLVDQLPKAQVANGWAVVLGEHLREGTSQADTWYHWGAIMLAIAVKAITGLPAIVALLGVSASVINAALVVAAAAVVRSVNGTLVGRSLLIGAASLVAVQWLRAYGLLWISDWFPNGLVQHMRWTLAQMFSYKFEGVLVLATIAAWHQRKISLAVLLLFCAGISAPHTVGALGAMAGTLGVIGLLTKQRALWQTSAVMVATLLSAWAVIHFGFGGGLPKAEGQSMVQWNLDDLRRSARAALIDTGIGLIVGALSLPGILHLIRARDAQATQETRTLGWMALTGIAGTYAAYSLMHSMADRFHFVLLVQAVLVLPAGIWGLARMAAIHGGAWRVSSGVVLILSTAMGIHDLVWLRKADRRAEWKRNDVAAIRSALQGQPFGYFADSDRQWWIPKQTILASLLEARCIRLNELPGRDSYTRYYGADLLHELVPRQPPESAETWSRRFAARLGIQHVLEIAPDTVPPAMQPYVKEVIRSGGLRLLELSPPPPTP